jgi:hypothetical protein
MPLQSWAGLARPYADTLDGQKVDKLLVHLIENWVSLFLIMFAGENN